MSHLPIFARQLVSRTYSIATPIVAVALYAASAALTCERIFSPEAGKVCCGQASHLTKSFEANQGNQTNNTE
jgi:hypothetical protein